MKQYECIKGFCIEACDGDGFAIENEYMDVDFGTIWSTPEDENYRLVGGEVRLENDTLGWMEISQEQLEECFKDVTGEDRVIQLTITDKLGTHMLQARDFVVKCKNCGKERPLYKNDIYKNELNIKKCECGGSNIFHYWLDNLYTEEEYEELEAKANK